MNDCAGTHASERLRSLLKKILCSDNFYARRLRALGMDEDAALTELPFTTKAELLADQLAHPPFGSVHLEPLAYYTRFCQTSGTTTGQPMAWLDTPESWQSMLRCWRAVYTAAELQPGVDRIFFAFAFGPFLGFWTAFEAAAADYLILPSGGMTSLARLQMLQRYSATVLCCTPTYALRLGELLQGSPHSVRKIIVAGEPGGSVPAVRAQIEALWGARVFDHHGMTEVGPVSYETLAQPGVLQLVDAYWPEVIDPATLEEVADGAVGELVLTTLDRSSAPLLRYRTGDSVRKQLQQGRLTLPGGILGRVDEMLLVRGVNVYPSAVENVLRQFPQLVEHQLVQRKVDAMSELSVRVELSTATPAPVLQAMEQQLRDTFTLRIPVELVATGSLPRFEFKAKRLVQE
jgi:phenylacetate-CoA ligase